MSDIEQQMNFESINDRISPSSETLSNNQLSSNNEVEKRGSAVSSEKDSYLRKNNDLVLGSNHDNLDDQEACFEMAIKDLSKDEINELEKNDSEFQEASNYLFNIRYDFMLKNALSKIFAKINTLTNDCTIRETGEMILSNLNKKYTPEQEEKLKNYVFDFNAPKKLNACLYELHEIYILNKDVLRKKCILVEEAEKYGNTTRLMLSRIPHQMLNYTKKYFSITVYKEIMKK